MQGAGLKREKLNSKVDAYLRDGCGRCKLYKTPHCKVHRWENELRILRKIILECDLKEELKWAQPCYTIDGKNVVLMSAFKEYVALAFFKGALLNDPHNLLITPGANSRTVRQLRFTQAEEIKRKREIIKEYIREAIQMERAGRKVQMQEKKEDLPKELNEILQRDSAFSKAFLALTPGRQRGWIIHFSQAKKPETRMARIEKARPQIMKGLGPHDAYRMQKGDLKNN